MAEISAISGGRVALAQRPVGDPLERRPRSAPDMTIAATNIIATQKIDRPTLAAGWPPRSMTTHSAAKVPYMKTSEWAKLMSRSTP